MSGTCVSASGLEKVQGQHSCETSATCILCLRQGLECHHVDQASPQASKCLPVSPLLEPQEHTTMPSFYFYMCSGRGVSNSGIHVFKASILEIKPSPWPVLLFVETGFQHAAQASIQFRLLPQPLQTFVTKPYSSFTTELKKVPPRQSNDSARVTQLVKGRATHENELCFPSDLSESNHWDLQYFTGSTKVTAPEQWPEVT